jgi:hypothetical protein
MNRNTWKVAVVAGALSLSGAALRAQDAGPETAPAPNVFMLQAGPEGMGPFGERVELLGFGGMHGKVVTGSPFSATAVSESTQTLADGNRITHKTQTTLYRDSQGRVRKEVSLPAIGPLAANAGPHSFIVINDPVAQTGYVLETDKKIARQLPHWKEKEKMKGGPGMPAPDAEAGASVSVEGGAAGDGEGNVMYFAHKRIEDDSDVKKEDLGMQTVGGVGAQGTRITRTIPAGQFGNEKPIVIVSERWYSADLQMIVKSTRNDPRFGTTTYTLTNIQRTEPNPSLFTVPAGYTVKTGGPGKGVMRFHREGPPPPPPPAN